MEYPQNETAEQQIIGQAFMDGVLPSEARSLTTSEFFRHKPIFEAVLELDMDGKAVNPIDVAKIVNRNHPSQKITVASLSVFLTGMVNHYNVTNAVAELRELSQKRVLIDKMREGINTLSNNGDIESVALSLNDQLQKTVDLQTTGFRKLSDVMSKDVYPALVNLKDGVCGKIAIGISAIDSAIGGGLSRSDVMVVAALPGSGKSAFVLQIARNIAGKGHPVAFYSGEMTDKENAFRMISQVGMMPNLNSRTYLHEDEFETAVDWSRELGKLPFYMDSKCMDLRSLAMELRRAVGEHGIQVAIVDYIQLLKLDRMQDVRRYERITEVSQELRRLALELNVAMVAVAQFNREGAKSGKPTMHDLEGSSQLEKDASIIFILDRDKDDPSNAATLRIEKGRNVGHGYFEGRFLPQSLTFEF